MTRDSWKIQVFVTKEDNMQALGLLYTHFIEADDI